MPESDRDETEQLVALLAQTDNVPQWLTQTGLADELTVWVTTLRPVAVLVLTFPWRIPAMVLNVPPQGFINVHFAPLPAYRGPAPTFWQIRNGETIGAVTVHRMTADFDAGAVLVTVPVPIGSSDTYGLHQAQLALAGVVAGQQLLAGLRGEVPLPEQPQEEAKATYWLRPVLADLCVDWEAPAEHIAHLVRAANPWNRGALVLCADSPCVC
jgi:methionyl-tRNA formyltransferase